MNRKADGQIETPINQQAGKWTGSDTHTHTTIAFAPRAIPGGQVAGAILELMLDSSVLPDAVFAGERRSSLTVT